MKRWNDGFGVEKKMILSASYTQNPIIPCGETFAKQSDENFNPQNTNVFLRLKFSSSLTLNKIERFSKVSWIA